MNDNITLVDNVKIQLDELETIQSIFYNPGEIIIGDKNVVEKLQLFVSKDGQTEVPRHLDYTLNLDIETHKFEISINLPIEYPIIEPSVYVRCLTFDREQQTQINSDLSLHISSILREEPCIHSIVTWVQDNALKYNCKVKEKLMTKKEETIYFRRLWIYSHHIYNKGKRKVIQDLAGECKLTGFCLPGKPGVICFEGEKSDCEHAWTEIKNMNWKKIVCVKQEEEVMSAGAIEKHCRFSQFKEVAFESGPMHSREYHTDFGKFYKFLSDHGCENIFKILFGIEGKIPLSEES